MGPSLKATLLFGAPLLVLALGHTLSNTVRTLPAIALDIISRDLAVNAETLASLVSVYHFAFAAGQIPVGVALDRASVRAVAMTLLALVAVGAALAAMADGATSYFIAQVTLGFGCCGMLLCPMTLAAKMLTPQKFGLWSGVIQGVGNSGMILSASPMAWLVERSGWRMGYALCAAAALGIGALVFALVPARGGDGGAPRRRFLPEVATVLRIGGSQRLRAVMLLAFVSFAAAIAVRGLWGGAWLMEVRGLDRVDAGHALMPFTLALVGGPLVVGLLDRRIHNRRALLAAGHAIAGAMLLCVAAAAPGGPLAWLAAWPASAASYDTGALFVFGAALSTQPLLFALGRAVVPPEHVGKALAAINLSFFCGAALIQSATGFVAEAGGMSVVFAFLGGLLLVASAAFVALPARPDRGAQTPL